MNQLRKWRCVEPKFLFRYRGDQLCARLEIRFIEHVRARLFSKVFRILGSEKRALVVIEPPRHLGRIRILEVYDYILIAIEQPIFPGWHRAVGHSTKSKFGARIKAFAVKAVEKCCGGRPVETMVVEAQSYTRHSNMGMCPSLPLSTAHCCSTLRDKALHNAARSSESQAETLRVVGQFEFS